LLSVSLVIAVGAVSAAHAQERSPITKFIVGGDLEYRPMTYADENGKPVGYDVDLAEAIAAHMNVPLQYETMAWDGIIPALEGKRIDAITSIAISEARKEVVTFSQPILAQSITTVVRADRPDFNPGPADLANLKVGVLINTAAAAALEKIGGITPLTYNSVPDAYNDVVLGRIDTVVIESVNGYYTVASIYPDKLRVTGVSVSDDPQLIGIAMRKDDAELHAAVDTALNAMRADGTLAAIATKWFGDTAILAEP
jgi:ABC-type amino acid transport substrate-binding protein